MKTRRRPFFFALFFALLIVMPVRAHPTGKEIPSAQIPELGLIDADDLWFSTFIGGYDFDDAQDVVVGVDGSIYVTGYAGQGFPTTTGAYQTTFAGGLYDIYVAKLNPDGKSAAYVTYIGGADTETSSGIAVDAYGAAYVVGSTRSSNFPTYFRCHATSICWCCGCLCGQTQSGWHCPGICHLPWRDRIRRC